MELKMLCVSGSPVKDGNLETFMKVIADEANKRGVKTDVVHLSRVKVEECIHCNYCTRKQTIDKYCALNDDAQAVFKMVEEADILVLCSPVYFMRTSARLAAFIDRLRVFIFGNVAAGRLKNKVGMSAAVAWARNGGFETTHLSHMYAFLTLEMIPVSVHACVSPLGASAVASAGGSGVFDKNIRLGIEKDAAGLHTAAKMVERAVELANILKSGSIK